MPNLMLFLISASIATACLTTSPEAGDPDEAEARQAQVVQVPFCEDRESNKKYIAGCTLPGNQAGYRNCVDHITQHYSIHLHPASPATCELDSTSVSTTCGLCQAFHGPGPDDPGGPLEP